MLLMRVLYKLLAGRTPIHGRHELLVSDLIEGTRLKKVSSGFPRGNSFEKLLVPIRNSNT